MNNPNEQEAEAATTTTSSINHHLKVNNNTLTKSEQDALLRSVLPSLNGQEGSPANTFTQSELDELQRAVGSISVGPRTSGHHSRKSSNNTVDIRDLQSSFQQPHGTASACPQDGMSGLCPQDGSAESTTVLTETKPSADSLDWHGAPRLHKNAQLPRSFREQVRAGQFQGPTNGVCPGFLQCNLVVLPQGPVAFDFLLFCQRNPKACPLIEVCDVGSPFPSGVAPGADLRTDVPKYAIYRNGQLEKEVTDVTDYWPEQSVAFLIGCSFSYDGALMDAGIPLKSAQQGKNVPMYRTNLKCRPAGSLSGNMVVSMKPIPALQVSKHVEITSKYTHAHGGPVAVGSASAIGVADINNPEWGEAIDVAPDEVPIFHACGVTPQSILMESKVPFAITHSAGHMFVTDLPSDMGV
ncbi:DUF1445 domain containing protein [Nitzschia inconspicua]|uniref:DUF1445 domain containing protein n=1 Tax=Nitzschia inconspicua TaxID=303405 RepID=A0A9K3KLZ1_9STRA|nr:DUF1445 domain containing protein [Nitzschia inconspicua]